MTDRRLAAIAESQHGLITWAQALDAGIPADALAHRAANGRLTRVQPCVYRVAGAPVTWHSSVLAALLAVPGAVASHGTAAALHGLRRAATTAPIEICVAGTTLPELCDIVVHRTTSLEPCDRATVDGIAVTSGARTVIDLAGRLDKAERIALVDDAIGARVAIRASLHARATALRSGRKGVGTIAAVTAPDAEGEFRSWLERQAARVIRRAGLPQPRWNEPVYADGRLLGVADTVWLPTPVIAEFDGPKFHSAPADLQKDKARDRALTAAGRVVLRFTWEDVVRRPEHVVADIRAALSRWQP